MLEVRRGGHRSTVAPTGNELPAGAHKHIPLAEFLRKVPHCPTQGGVHDGRAPKNPHVVEPRSSTVSFVTTEHFTLQGAGSATVAESTGRGSIFLMSVSGGLVGW